MDGMPSNTTRGTYDHLSPETQAAIEARRLERESAAFDFEAPAWGAPDPISGQWRFPERNRTRQGFITESPAWTGGSIKPIEGAASWADTRTAPVQRQPNRPPGPTTKAAAKGAAKGAVVGAKGTAAGAKGAVRGAKSASSWVAAAAGRKVGPGRKSAFSYGGSVMPPPTGQTY